MEPPAIYRFKRVKRRSGYFGYGLRSFSLPVPPLPPPLPPETRTVGQLVAETLRFYGRRWWASLALGAPVAVADQLTFDAPLERRILVLVAFAPLFTVAYATAAALLAGRRPNLLAIVLGTLAFLPAAVLFPWFALAAVVWLALVGLVVPVAVIERRGPLVTVRRAFALARADYVHALGSLATLVILFGLTRLVLAALLQSQADNAVRTAIFLADLVISPVVFLGAALLYYDQEARARVSAAATPRSRRRSS